jgi:3-hydroxyisobutyrate dehydrogenase
MKLPNLFFDVLGKIAIHVGEAELLVQQNLLLIITRLLQGLAETILFAEQNGVSKEDMLNYK